MEQFPDGALVRLRSRDHGGYLHADEDGMAVSLSWGLRSMSMAWKVQRVLHDGSTRLLLHSAAYRGRYLAASSDPAPPGYRVFLGDAYDGLIVWKAVESGSAGYVFLVHVSDNLLRANDRQQSGVCIDVAHNQSTMMLWKVETIPTARPAAAVEPFSYGALVRLQSRVRRRYLHADKDGMAVSLCRRRDEFNVAWKVHRILHKGSTSILLQSCAHGRYLATSTDAAPPGHPRHRVVLADCDRNVDRVLWEAVGSGEAGYVLLRHVSNRLLRADGRHGGGGVSMDVAGNSQSTMMHWKVYTIPASGQASPSEAVMEQLPDGVYLRLRSRVNGWYLHANEDGLIVNFLPHHGSLNAAWRVHRVLHRGTSRVLLQSAAYGRYLGASRLTCSTAFSTLLSSIYYNDLPQHDLHWECEIDHGGSGVFWLVTRQSVFIPPLLVEFIPSRKGSAPVLPRAPAQVSMFRRLVIYIHGDEYGNIDFTGARAIAFEGRSVAKLRTELAVCVEELPERIAICLWAGSYGRLIPLISDLPANNQTVEVIVFETSSRAALGLHYPIVDGEQN